MVIFVGAFAVAPGESSSAEAWLPGRTNSRNENNAKKHLMINEFFSTTFRNAYDRS